MIITALALLTLSAFANEQVPDPQVRLETFGSSHSLIVTPPGGHHMNVKAPLKADIDGKALKKTAATPEQARFEARPGKKFNITTYLCDDANTYCVKRGVSGEVSSLPVKAGKGPTKPAPTTTESPSAVNHGREAAKRLGFIYNDSATALMQARKSKKPLLIEFFGIWCPPCNILDNTVFRSPEYQNLRGQFVTVKLDADDQASWELKERYRVGGYPTVIFADSQGDEILRVVGALKTSGFVKKMQEALARKNEGLTTLLERGKSGDSQAAYLASLTLIERQDFTQAKGLLAEASQNWKKNDARFEALSKARVGELKHAVKNGETHGSKNSLITELTRAFDSVPDGFYRLSLAQELADAYEGHPTKQKKFLQESVRIAKALVASPIPDDQEWQAPDLWVVVASSEEALGNKENAHLAYAQTAVEYEKLIESLGSAKAHDRGYQTELAHAYAGSGRLEKASTLLSGLEKKYPREFTFFYNHAYILKKAGKAAQAREKAEQALRYSYGDNRLRAANLLGQLLLDTGEAAQGLTIVREALNKAVLPKDPFNRTHRYIQQLKNLEQGLSKMI